MRFLEGVAILAVLALIATVTPVLRAAQHSAAGHVSVLPSDLEWVPAPSVGPGAQMVVIEGDLKATAPFTFRLKIPPNFRIGVHTHPVVERVTVMSGTFHLGVGNKFDKAAAKAYPVGGVAVMPAGMPMFAYTTREETIIQVHGTGPWGIKYLDPADDPLKK